MPFIAKGSIITNPMIIKEGQKIVAGITPFGKMLGEYKGGKEVLMATLRKQLTTQARPSRNGISTFLIPLVIGAVVLFIILR